MGDTPETRIVRWSDPAQVPEITALLHTAYAPLAEAGLRYLATYQDDEVTLERLSNGESYLALLGEKIIGTITLSLPGQIAHSEYFNRPGVAVFHQFAVAPEHQCQGIGGTLLDHIESRARELGASELACDTAESAEHLIAKYQRRGFALVGHEVWDVTNYRSVLLAKPLA